MARKRLDTPLCEFSHHVAFTGQIFGSNLRTSQVDAIVEGVHFGAAFEGVSNAI
jgi:hypothetical protein